MKTRGASLVERARRSRLRWVAALVLAWLCGHTVSGEVRLNALFSDGVVLQHGRPIPVWGEAAPGESVAVSFAGQTRGTQADARGAWSVRLDALSASNESRTLTVQGRNRLEIKNVLVGEVWLFSGQSNMAYLMDAMARPSDRDRDSPVRAERDMAAANDPLLREFRVDNRAAATPRRDVRTRTGWMTWNPQAAGGWAAMAVYFGQRLRAELDVPVGIIMCAWGGSGCSAWIGGETLRNGELNTLWPEDVPGWRPNLAPSRLYNGMLRPLAPFAIAGFGWYQGETEASPYHNPYLYRFLLAAMIRDWRQLWGQADLPFIVVQLPNRDNEPRWVVVRESQAVAARATNAALLTAIDLGQPWDLHPKNKPDIANRLADFVLTRSHGRKTWPGEATFVGAVREGSALRLNFEGGAGLRTSDGLAPAEFAVAGEDRAFHPAVARFDGESVLVGASQVAMPVAVRYAWTPAPRVNLVNAGGMPVAPFRSDDWPVEGQERVPQSLAEKAELAERVTGGQLADSQAAGWRLGGGVTQFGGDAPQIVRRAGAAAAILVRGFPLRAGLHASPDVHWTAEPALNAARGCTVEVRADVGRVGNPDRGLDLEVGLPGVDGTFRRYLLTAFPMRLHAFENNLAPRNSWATETRVLRSDLENEPAAYRLAIRPDGIAQVYYNGALVGTSAGEQIVRDSPTRAYLRVGKTVLAGEWQATLQHVAWDTGGAFAPAR